MSDLTMPTPKNQTRKGITTVTSTGLSDSLQDTATLLQRLARIQRVLHILDVDVVSLCVITSDGTKESIDRLLDPHLDDKLDMALSSTAAAELREQAKVIIDKLESLGITLSEEVLATLTEQQL